jgi:hypothetical protein
MPADENCSQLHPRIKTLGFVPRRKDAPPKGGAFFLAGRLAANAGQGAGTLRF